jgi:hypothetical protein
VPTAYIWACRVGAAGAMEIIHPRIVPKMCFYTSERWRTGSGKMDGFAHGGNMGAAELSQQDLGVSRAVAEGNEGAAPVRRLSLIKNTIRARATASRILEERALSSWQRVG